jgi:hypothetical protein
MLNNVLFMLLGTGLVTVGFLAAAYAERIRGARAMKILERPTTRPQEQQASRPSSTIEPAAMSHARSSAHREMTNAPAEMPRTPTITRISRATRQAPPSPGDEVVAALIAAGYKRTIAAEATWACGEAERTTIENWTVSALRRCAQGGPS